ncbi:hypothetical protein CDEF62S_05513 [Castellaniella defragrans]
MDGAGGIGVCFAIDSSVLRLCLFSGVNAMTEVLIKAGFADKVSLNAGDKLEVINVQGGQVCDLFAFKASDYKEFLSPSHTRTVHRRTYLKPGDILYSVLKNGMLKLLHDDVGVNDFLVPACDPGRYLLDFGLSDHRNCRDNLAEVVGDRVPYEYLPDPFNIFQETSVNSKGLIMGGASPAKEGDKVIFEALMDVVVVGSACPQDKAPTNNFNPTDILFKVA